MPRTIMVDPGKLEAAAQKMDTQSAEYQNLYNKLFTEVEGMAANWQGADNLAYTTQIKGFTDDFQKMVALMNEYSRFLREAAKRYRETQNEIIAGAKRLTN